VALQDRYRVEGRRSLERLEDAVEHLLRMFRGVSAAHVKGGDAIYPGPDAGKRLVPTSLWHPVPKRL
jgi:hypothetical protein